jgi:undecaprenyl diphosphate synthase
MKHLWVIMDWNRSWAKNKKLPELVWHKYWADNVEKVVLAAKEKWIEFITLWWLSTDNLEKRSDEEVKSLIKIINNAKKYLKNIMDQWWKIQLIGDIQKLPEESQNTLNNLVEQTKHNTEIIITLALVYWWQDEIRRWTIKAIKSWKNLDNLSKEEFREYLDCAQLPVVDMIVRTWWHKRTSGFLLYDSEYAELYFTDKNWPDFWSEDLDAAIEQFNDSKRKFWK